jgi:hypothetical protein
MRPSFTRRFAFPFLAVAILLLAGCASFGSTSGSPPQSGTAAQIPTAQSTKPTLTNLTDYCHLVSLAEVSQITNLTITQLTPLPNSSRQRILCGYLADAAASAGAVIVFYVLSDAGQAQTTFGQLKKQAQSGGATTINLSGIGESAFTTQQNGANGVVVLKGQVVFQTSGTTPHPLPLAVCQQLARLVVSRL